jgi:hypothetical protein
MRRASRPGRSPHCRDLYTAPIQRLKVVPPLWFYTVSRHRRPLLKRNHARSQRHSWACPWRYARGCEIVHCTDGRWMVRPPERCPRGHRLGAGRVLVAHQPCSTRCGGHDLEVRSMRRMYGPPLRVDCRVPRPRPRRHQRLILRPRREQLFVDAGGGAGPCRPPDMPAARYFRRADRGPAGSGRRSPTIGIAVSLPGEQTLAAEPVAHRSFGFGARVGPRIADPFRRVGGDIVDCESA